MDLLFCLCLKLLKRHVDRNFPLRQILPPNKFKSCMDYNKILIRDNLNDELLTLKTER